jgi:hypothetical protein
MSSKGEEKCTGNEARHLQKRRRNINRKGEETR